MSLAKKKRVLDPVLLAQKSGLSVHDDPVVATTFVGRSSLEREDVITRTTVWGLEMC